MKRKKEIQEKFEPMQLRSKKVLLRPEDVVVIPQPIKKQIINDIDKLKAILKDNERFEPNFGSKLIDTLLEKGTYRNTASSIVRSKYNKVSPGEIHLSLEEEVERGNLLEIVDQLFLIVLVKRV